MQTTSKLKNRINLFLGVLLLLAVISCNTNNNNEQLDQSLKDTNIQNMQLKPEAEKIHKVSGKCAVFFAPDSVQIEKMIKDLGKDKFFTMADENNSASEEAMDFFDKNNIKYSSTRYSTVEFVKDSITSIRINLLTYNYSWGVLLFDGVKDPIKVDTKKAKAEAKKYFGL